MAHPPDLDGRVAVITGSAHGIGAATAHRLADDGAAVFLVDRSEDVFDVRDRLRAEGRRAEAALMDVSDERSWNQASATCRARLGPPHILVNNAFTVDIASLADTSLAGWERQIGVNLTGAYLATRALLEDLRSSGRGAIVMVSSVHAHFGLPGRAAYASTKAGLTGLTRQLAAEYGPALRVNSVLPGPVLTAAWDGIEEEAREGAAASTVLNRLGEPSEVADAIAYLCSDRASFITGTELTVDGGWSITKDSA